MSLAQTHRSDHLTPGTPAESLFTAAPQRHHQPSAEGTPLYILPPKPAAQRQEIPEGTQRSEPQIQAVIAQSEEWANRSRWREQVHTQQPLRSLEFYLFMFLVNEGPFRFTEEVHLQTTTSAEPLHLCHSLFQCTTPRGENTKLLRAQNQALKVRLSQRNSHPENV